MRKRLSPELSDRRRVGHRPRRDCSTGPGYPVNPPTVTLSLAALIALGPTPGIVKKLAEILDYGRHQAEARVGECLMTWEYSIAFRKRAFVRLILKALGSAGGRRCKESGTS
jgi:hypothetical protein